MEIKAFKAYRFDDAVVGDASACIAPPYDVIDDNQQAALYAKSEYNIARVTRGKTFADDNEGSSVYTRAAQHFNNWLAQGAIKEDEKEAIYGYVQDFSAAGMTLTRSGFIALGKLAAFGKGVQPHEKTLDGPKADRLKLTRATAAQFGQIFMLYDDPKKIADGIIDQAAKGKPIAELVDDDGVQHRIYAIEDAAAQEAIIKMMANKSPVIADGHHRYETALNYFNETKNPKAEYCMITFVNMYNEGLVVLPTHRLVDSVEGFDMGLLITAIGQMFDITEYRFSGTDKDDAKKEMFTAMLEDFKAGANSFGIYGNDESFYKIKLKSLEHIRQAAPELSDASQQLDVWILHRLILDGILGIGDKQLAAETNLEYIKDIGDAIDHSIAAVDSGKKQVVFFMNPTRVEQVKAVADAGEKMPQKSTFFYPKIFTGFTINKF